MDQFIFISVFGLTLTTKMYNIFIRFRDAERSENLGGAICNVGVKNLGGGKGRARPKSGVHKSYFPTF